MGFAAVALSAMAQAQDGCSKLKALPLVDTTITGAQTVPAGSYPVARGAFQLQLPEHCRVTGSIRPTGDSDIRFELWLPASGWNHRYRQVGNGGLAGYVNHLDMIQPLRHGWAVASTDDGHDTAFDPTGFDARWAVGHPEKVKDYGHRAVHLTALTAQALVTAYYSRRAEHTYFTGCSDGGRESLMEAQRYPGDFDGYLVGAPGIDLPNQELSSVHVWRALHALGPDQQLSAAQLGALSAAVLERCDALDGVKDGVLRDPRRCDFRPRELVCGHAAGPACLSEAQAEALQKIYDGLRDPATGAQLAPGAWGTLGTELPWLPNFLRDAPGRGSPGAPSSLMGAVLYGNPILDPAALNIADATKDAKLRLNPIVNSDDPDLGAARRMGRKILHYHGWADPIIAAQYSVAYFNAVQKFMKSDTGDFYRLFMVPGMAHCDGGVGPTYLDDIGGAASDPERDWLTALMRWVEKGKPPQRLIATDFEVDRSGPWTPDQRWIPPGAPVRSARPLCPYPQVAVYRGAGSTDDAASFRCAAPAPE
jgi:feruloyl esterase